ncbi:MAG: DUF262 domain-containing HNH endonuclease family protein [Chloroflexi bacterium]|nr:DUF262 domain-containing HNH endonuclease family protein [Chloroflexota bacterium]
MENVSKMTPHDIFIKIVRYEVPPFQRRYTWGKEEQWEPLWDDVSAQAEAILEHGQTDKHFMGAIVLQQRLTPASGIETRIVVDGQQRLTTLQLLIDAIQEVFEQSGHSGAASRLAFMVQNQEAFIGGNPDRNVAFKVWPTINDQAAFRQAMKNDLPSDKYKTSRIVEAHNYFKGKTEQWLQVYLGEDDQREEAAEALDRAVRDYLELVVIDLGQSDDPHIIFETLNARGTPLLPSDMIKNQILHKAGIGSDEDSEQLLGEAEKLWGFSEDWWAQEIGRGYQRRPRIDVYLNNWLTVKNQSETKAQNEFAVFSDYVEEAEKCGKTIQSIAADIRRLGDIYRDIYQHRLPEIEQFLYRHQVMGIGVVVPVLLWLLSSDVPKPQLSKSITAIESYLIRRMACGLSARGYSRVFVGMLQELESAGHNDADDTIVDYLLRQTAYANLWPDDTALLNAFLTQPLYRSLTQRRLNLILQGIEGALRTPMADTQQVPRNLTIEHIMPQAWGQNWNEFPDDVEDREQAAIERDRIIHTMGNLSLTTGRLGSSLSNRPWSEKREILREHFNLSLNKDYVDEAKWDEKAIEERARRLAQVAIKVWPHADGI